MKQTCSVIKIVLKNYHTKIDSILQQQIIFNAKGAELLDLVDTPKQKILLTEVGKRFVESDTATRKHLWKEQLSKLTIYKHIIEMLRNAPKGRLERYQVEKELVLYLPQEDPFRLFNILTSCARYGELFAYSEDTGYITFE